MTPPVVGAATRQLQRGPISRRRLLALLALAGPVGSWQLGAAAESTRPIRFVVPNAAGGSSDLLARLFGGHLAEAWEQPVTFDLRPGAAGRIAADVAARAAPDGHTLLLANNGTLALAPGAAPLVPVTRLTTLAIVIAAAPSLGVRTLAELIDRARGAPAGLAYASGGIGSTSHAAAALLARRAGIRLLQIPYPGTATAVKDVLSGEIPLLFTQLATVAPLIRSGQLRALAVTGASRTRAFPEIRTVAESGFPGFDVTTWHGVLLPPGTRREVVTRLHDQLLRILALPRVREQLAAMAMEPVGNTPEQFAAELQADRLRWAAVNGPGTALD